MRTRTGLVLGVVVGYLAFVAHTTTGTQCPRSQVGPCARVHALFTGARAPEPPLVTVAAPMRGRGGSAHEREAPLRLAAAPARR
jgi:hypothetical protein